MEAGYASLHLARSPAEQVELTLLACVVAGVGFAWLMHYVGRRGDRRVPGRTLAFVMAAGLAFRLTLLPLPNATSPDVTRYLWEGVIQSHGFNPYIDPPNADVLQHLEDAYPALHAAVNRPEIHPHVPTIYPPVAQVLFLANAVLFDGALWGWKLILLLFDAVLLVGAAMILRHRSWSTLGLAGVAWCPLLIVESYEAAHLDLVGVSLVVLAIAAMDRRRTIVAGTLLGLAINIKYLWPALVGMTLLPVAWRQRRMIAFVVSAAMVSTACWIPYRDGFASAWATARMFAENWTFNDLAFEALRHFVKEPRWAPMVLVSALLVALGGGLIIRRRRESWPDVWLLSGTALLLSPVAYPWYFLWIVPALIARPPAWLTIWVVTVPALHIVDWHLAGTGEWDSMPWLWGVITIVPGVLLGLAWWRRMRHADTPLPHGGA